MLIIFDPRVRRGIQTLFHLAGVRAWPWIAVSALLMIAQTMLGTVPVAAMLPLLELFSSSTTRSWSIEFVAGVIGNDEPRVLIPVFALCVAGVFLLCSALSILLTWLSATRTTKLGIRASAETLRRYGLEPYERHRTRENAEIFRNVSFGWSNATALGQVLVIYNSALTLVAICAVLVAVSPMVTLMTIVLFGGAMALTQRIVKPALRRAGAQVAESDRRSWTYVFPIIDGFREARMSASVGRLVSRYTETRLDVVRANRTTSTLGVLPPAVSQVVFALAIAGISAILFSTGSAESAIVTLGLFGAAAMRALPTLNLLYATIGSVRTSEVPLVLLADAVDDLGRSPAFDERRTSSTGFAGDIELRDVGFRYADATTPVLDRIDLTICENTMTAIVGSSGAGKSTVVDIILGLLEPTQGSVTCGGAPISDDLATWHRGIGVVYQDVYLMNDTLLANVAFGSAEGDVDEVAAREALATARLLEVVDALPDGLHTLIGENGTRLSGGQRQRLGLARALYRRPHYLLLDEATSALDNETEAEITAALAALHGDVTIIVIAHRLSTVRNADKLVFLDHGVVAAEGAFDEVQASTPAFARLVELGRLTSADGPGVATEDDGGAR